VSLFRKYVFPRVVDLVMNNENTAGRRAVLIPRATGSVLEVGIGSGLNLPFYSSAVTHLRGVDPSAELLAMVRQRSGAVSFPVELDCRSAEQLPVDAGSIDTVVTTWTLCSIPDPVQALREMKRVLKPGGQLLFVEHGFSRDRNVQVWQRRLNPVWRRISGGCNVDRKIDELVRAAGFHITQLETSYLPGPRIMTHTYEGCAGH
jgi:ubiquinone/menaquinone biosynthesis C-methylase UbiE